MTVNIINRYITFYKAKKVMEREYERCLKYREDYYPENYNQKLTCWDCGKEKSRRLFPYRKQYKYNKEKRCKLCNKNNYTFRRSDRTLKQVLQECLKTSKINAKKRFKNGRVECGVNTLKIEQLIKMYKDQKGKCKLSGEILSLQKNSKHLVSLDRIDSTKGYTIDNVQLVTKITNIAKSDLDDETFDRMIYGLYNTKCKNETIDIIKNNNRELELKIEKLKIIIQNSLKEKERLKKLVQSKNIKIQELSENIPKNKCIDCNIGIDKTSTRCHSCNCKFIFESNKKDSKRPPYNQLLKDKEELKSNVKIGKKYGVSDNAVRKWFKSYEKYKN